MEHYRRFAKNVGLMGITQILLAAQGFLLLPILTKFLGATNYGIWSQFKVTALLLSSLSMLGLENAVIRFLSSKEDNTAISKELISIWAVIASIAASVGIIVFIFSENIAQILTQMAGSGIYFKFIILFILFEVTHSLFTTYYRARQRIKLYSFIELLRVSLELVILYYVLYSGFEIIGVIITFIAVKLITILISLFSLRSTLKISKPSISSIKPYLIFSLPLTINPLLFWILQVGDQYVIGFYIGAASVGIYALAYSLCRIIRILADPILLVLHPAMCAAWEKKNQKHFRTYFEYSYKYIFMLVIPAVFGLSLLAKPVLGIISNVEFVGGSVLIPIISTGIGVYLLFSLGVSLLTLTKDTKKITGMLIFLAIFNIVANIVLVPILGSIGAALTTLATFIIAGFYGLMIIKRFKLNLMPLFLFKCLISSIIMTIIVIYIRSFTFNIFFKLVLILIVSSVSYFVILFLLKAISKSEIKFFMKLLKQSS